MNQPQTRLNMSRYQREFQYTRQDFDVLRKLSNEYTGIVVPDDKFDMFYSRLSKHVRRLGFEKFSEYCALLSEDQDREFSMFINSITTNLTSFFREKHHFEYLVDPVIPELLTRNAGSRRIRIWSAGCSTGEEAYSIAMTVLPRIPVGWNLKILATDLDTDVLDRAAHGVYPKESVEGLSIQLLKRWFQRGTGTRESFVKVKSELRKVVRFESINLIGEWPNWGLFDAIFCRNVLIYFDRATKGILVKRFEDQLAGESYLFIGHSESLHQINNTFQLVGNTLYRKQILPKDEYRSVRNA